MSEQIIKEAIANQKMICPQCQKPIRQYEKFAETLDAAREGFNIVEHDSRGSRVTLTCGNDGCDFKERTEYWEGFIED